jgi:hypothetical protein
MFPINALLIEHINASPNVSVNAPTIVWSFSGMLLLTKTFCIISEFVNALKTIATLPKI